MSKYVVDELSRVTTMALSDERLSQEERDDIKHVVGMVHVLADWVASFDGSNVPRELWMASDKVKYGSGT